MEAGLLKTISLLNAVRLVGLEFNRLPVYCVLSLTSGTQAAGTGDRDIGQPLGSIHLMVCVFLSPFWMDAAVVQVSNPVLNSRH